MLGQAHKDKRKFLKKGASAFAGDAARKWDSQKNLAAVDFQYTKC